MITASFTDVSTPGPSGPITAWEWDFGDGGTSTSQNPTHGYAAAGTYTVTLTITGTGNDGTSTVSKSITVNDPTLLTSAFTESISGLAVTFTDASVAGPSGPITAWAWDFGDGGTSTSQNPSHTYAASGMYDVTLVVTGTSPDGTANSTQSIHVLGGSPDFFSSTFTARPTTLAGTSAPHQKPFTTFAQLKTLLAAAVAGDYIYYNGTGVLDVASSSTDPWKLSGINPSGRVTVDLGTRVSGWDPSKESANYVSFRYTGSSQFEAISIEDCSNLTFYGGSLDSGIGGGALRVFGGCDSIVWLEGYVAKAGGSGIMLQPIDGTTGASESITNCVLHFEINRCCMNPAFDTHADKGTGMHGVIIHGNSGHFDDNEVFVYVHDPLQPGETSAGKTWPEGACGSGIEAGTNASGGATSQNGNRYAVLGENLNMTCDGTNPGSGGAKQTGGNGINWWGSVPLNSTEVVWLELNNSAGQASHGVAGGWHPGTPAIAVLHGRHSNTNQAYPLNSLSSSTDSYDRRWGINYSDCT